MREQTLDWYMRHGWSATSAATAAWWTNLGWLLLSALILYFILKFLIVRIVHALLQRLKLRNVGTIFNPQFLGSLTHLVPVIYIRRLSPAFLGTEDAWSLKIIYTCTHLYLLFTVVLATFALINGIAQLYSKSTLSKEYPLTAFVQILKIVIALVALILGVSILVDRSPVLLLSGLGAMSAITLLIYKDTILGFVAGIQLTGNRMIAMGDWIEMPKYNADGIVEEIALTTVKVRNWDLTRTTIPTYALISDSFKNWRGMKEADARRIKRALMIDLQSIGLLDASLRDHLNQFSLLKDYFKRKDAEIHEWNRQHEIDATPSKDINRRQLTNIGTYRAYAEAYLRKHPQIRQDRTLLVRHLAPTENGLPLEIYCFSSDILWANYEAIQADIFDHLIAIAPHFKIKLYQNPTSYNVRIAMPKEEASR